MIEYSAEAAADVARQHAWLLQHSTKAADAFLRGLEATMRRIESGPAGFRVLSDGASCRAAFWLRRTSYPVDFRTVAGRTVILRVWHGRQNRPE